MVHRPVLPRRAERLRQLLRPRPDAQPARRLRRARRAVELDPLSDFGPEPQAAPSTVQLRTYRLALASDPRYARYFGAANVTAAKVALMNRVNQVYENELAIHMVLVADNDKLNLDTAARDDRRRTVRAARRRCYKPAQVAFCSGATLVRNRHRDRPDHRRRQLRHRAHRAGRQRRRHRRPRRRRRRPKAEGCTGVPTPEGDFYAVDYVAHEMGHQFGGNHTFNGNRCELRLRQPQRRARRSSPAAARRSWPTPGSAARTTCSRTATRTSPSAASSEIGDYVSSRAAAAQRGAERRAARLRHRRRLVHAHLQRRDVGADRPRHELHPGRRSRQRSSRSRGDGDRGRVRRPRATA